MNELIKLGYGWYELENSHRWTADGFSIYILDKDIDSIVLHVNYNSRNGDNSMLASIDDWKTAGKVELKHGLNSIHAPLNRASEIKFFCNNSFVPANISTSNDFRKLGIHVSKITIQCGNNIREIPIGDIKNETLDCNYEINDSISHITFSSGWHELEEGKRRWSNGKGEISIGVDCYTKIKLGLFSPNNQFIKVLLDDKIETTEKLFEGKNDLYIDIKNIRKISLNTKTFCPKSINSTNKDTRNLGIQILNVEVIGDTTSKNIPIRNIYFQHDIPRLLSFIQKYKFVNENITHIGGFGDIIVDKLTNVDSGKLNLNDQLVFFAHRSGWSSVINSLLKHHNEDGIKFEGFLERPFVWNKKWLLDNKMLPFNKPWIGVLHNPWTFPTENNESVTTEDTVKSQLFQESLSTCKGLYVLSKDLMTHVKREVNVPVNFLYHPTEFVKKTFSIEKFKQNSDKKILEVGSWLRRVNSMFLLDSDPKIWKKVKIIPALLNFEKMLLQIKNERIQYNLNITKKMEDDVTRIAPLSDDDYDDFLTNNVVFIDLYASSANNAIIECIARGTPILINPLPSVVEYLGEEYPFYFNSMEEASYKINDLQLIEETHEYLMNYPIREFLKMDYFLKEFENGSIFNSL